METWNCSIHKKWGKWFHWVVPCYVFPRCNLKSKRTMTQMSYDFWKKFDKILKKFCLEKKNTFAYSIKKLPWKFIAETNRKKTFGCIGKSFNNCQVRRQISMAESPKCMHSTTKPLTDLLMPAFFQFKIIFCWKEYRYSNQNQVLYLKVASTRKRFFDTSYTSSKMNISVSRKNCFVLMIPIFLSFWWIHNVRSS